MTLRAPAALAAALTLAALAATSCQRQKPPETKPAPPPPSAAEPAPFVMDANPRAAWELEPELQNPPPRAALADLPPSSQPSTEPAPPMLAELPETAPTTATAPTEVTLEVRRHLRAGDAALAEGNVTKALEHFSLAVARDPSDLDALKAMAATLTVAGRHEEALDFHRMIARLLPGQRAPRFNCAMALARMRRFTEAQEQLLELLAEAPDDVRCRYNLAGIYQAQGKFDLAAETWDHVLKQGSSLAASDLAAAHTSHGQALSALSDHQRAMTAYAEAAKLRPDDLGAWLNLSAAAQSAGSYGRAIFAAKQAAALAPMEPALWNRLGEIWLELHRATNRPDCLKEALEAWRVSVRLKPDQPEISRLLRVYEPAASAPTTGASP